MRNSKCSLSMLIQTPKENNYRPKSPMDGQTTTKSGWIRQQENGNLGRGYCSLFGTHYTGVASYVLYHDKCATSTKCFATNLVDTQQWRGWYLVATIHNMEKIIPTWPTPCSVLLLKMFFFSQGKGKAFVNPIKGGMKENILEWMRIRFSACVWCVVK